MENWIEIGDDEIAQFGKHSYFFKFEDNEYNVIVDQSEQGFLLLEHEGNKDRWGIEVKKQLGSSFKISGMAFGFSNILSDAYWYELHLSEEPKIVYWGNQVIYRIDQI